MKIKSTKSTLNGEISVPGSKSHTIRAVAVATMAEGTSTIKSPLISGDTLSSLEAATAFGATVEKFDDYWTVKGIGGNVSRFEHTIDMGNSGTSLRIFTGLAATLDFPVKFDGDSSLRSRPMSPVLDALERLGVNVDSNEGKCPLTLTGPVKGGETEVEGQSSQFLTSLLFALPLAEGDSYIKVNNLNEIPYVYITLDWLERQGIELEHADDLSWVKVKGGQAYKAYERAVPADFSTATFPLVAAAVTGATLKIHNLDFEDRQGDKAVFGFLEKMGMTVERGEEYTTVSLEGKLQGCELDLNDTPDALPALSVAACFAEGTTTLGNVAQARIKETDRIDCMTKELTKMGAKITELEDGMIIEGGHTLTGCEVESYHDHRIAMALTIAGFAAEGETVVNDADAAAVTYPNFIGDFRGLGGNIEEV